jgi:hypothetical protein
MASRFEIELMPPNEWGARMALIRVDGRPLLDFITEIEAPIAAEAGQPDLAGTYGYLNAVTVVYPSRHLLGQAARSLLEYSDKVSVLECACGCEGCWPLLVRITVTDEEVVWSDFQQPHRDNWIYPAGLRLVFDRIQYERELGVPSQQNSAADLPRD